MIGSGTLLFIGTSILFDECWFVAGSEQLDQTSDLWQCRFRSSEVMPVLQDAGISTDPSNIFLVSRRAAPNTQVHSLRQHHGSHRLYLGDRFQRYSRDIAGYPGQ